MVLAVLQGFEGGDDVLVGSVPFLVGRRRAANLIIPHVSISRNHCEILYENGEWKLRDTSSSGTFVNGRLIGNGSEKAIEDGDFLTLGSGEVNISWTFRPMNVELGPTARDDGNGVSQSRSAVPTHSRNRGSTRGAGADAELTGLHSVREGEIRSFALATRPSRPAENDGDGTGSLSSADRNGGAGTDANANANPFPEYDATSRDALQHIAELVETELQCTVCSELFVRAVTLSCSHTFCRFCLSQWKKKQKSCPICRKKITTATRSLVVDNYIDRVVEHLPRDLRERRLAVAREREQQEPSPGKRSSRSRKSSRPPEA